MAAVCTAQHQQQGLGYCQIHARQTLKAIFSVRLSVSLRMLSQPPCMLTLLLSHSARKAVRLSLCPFRWLLLSGKFCSGAI